MSPRLPLVSVIVPVLDEEHDIAGCIASIAAQTFPLEYIEVLLVDGGSTDATVERALDAAEYRGLSMRVLSNPERLQSAGLNVALAVATGEVLVRIDARSIPAANHIARCVEVLGERPEVGAVGGAQIASARSASLVDQAIARALNNRYATGLARYRRRAASGATDTVWMGAFRARDIRAIGGWDAAVAKNEDFELNERLRKNGFVVWFDETISARYLPRTSVRAIAQQYFNYGTIKGTMWATKWRPSPRQIVLLVTPAVAIGATITCAYFVGWLPVLAASVVGAGVVDAIGNRGAPASPAVRSCAAIVNGVVGGSWWLGVVSRWCRRSRRRQQPAPSVATGAATAPRSGRADAALSTSRR
jgi:succinoglycan biosynthesis protein ExoA